MVATLVALVAASGCRKQEARPEELFQAQASGLGFLEIGQLAEAEEQFRRVVALAPAEPLGYANLGLTYLRGARFADAEKQLRRARELDPANVEVGLMLARLYASRGDRPAARSILDQLRAAAPREPRVPYALAELSASRLASDPTVEDGYRRELGEALALAPTNVAVRLKLIESLVRSHRADSAVAHLEEIRRIGPELPPEVSSLVAALMAQLRAGDFPDRARVGRLLHLMETTQAFQASLAEVRWLEGPIAGRPIVSFTPKSLALLRASGLRKGESDLVRFVDATTDAGLPGAGAPGDTSRTAIASGDYDGDGIDDLFVSVRPAAGRATARLFRAMAGQFSDATQRARLDFPGGARFATFADLDNDGRLDLFVLGEDGRPSLWRNAEGGRFTNVTARSGIPDGIAGRKALMADLDHDGDLDILLVGGAAPLLYRNNLDGTFTDVTASSGFGADAVSDARFADVDDDGRIDVLATGGRTTVYRNGGNGRFVEGALTGIPDNGASIVAIADYDNDGQLDVLRGGPGAPELWRNAGGATFHRDARSASAFRTLGAATIRDLLVMDYDNDGWLDLVVGTTAAREGERGVFLFRNDRSGRFLDRSGALPVIGASTAMLAADVNGDGAEDLLITGREGVRLLRNEGGGLNLSMQLQLVGLRTGSGKNNYFGIGARVEVRAAELYQTRVVTSRVTRFGLGTHLKADVVRVQWPNGVAQTVYFPGSDQDVLENEVLKGSCAFLYAWDGHAFRFVTDVMWRSALGMPLGILGSNTAYAPAGASQEYLRIPSSVLRPRDGKYVLQLTEELWETAYADHLQLLAVDHPDSVDIFVDERFVPPGPLSLEMFRIAGPTPPLTAVDDRGNDVLPALLRADSVYVSNLTPLRYQGVVETHDLIMDLGPGAGSDSTYLLLRGWIYPTDASINVALSQQSAIRTLMPSLEVRDARGRWMTAIPSLGFPSGKDKTIVIDLSGKFPTADHHVRIRTNLQIYWDQATVARNARAATVRVTTLTPESADLHFRGFSRTYRKGGRYGPWWFDYDSVTRESPWRPIEGRFTRFGDVRSLLTTSDDMYVIMAPGDEMTLQFDASSAAALPAGWTRDFLLYTDGWIKDSDLNTAFGTTVEPLPFHAIRQYPYAKGESYPGDAAHQRYRSQYNTRAIPGGR